MPLTDLKQELDPKLNYMERIEEMKDLQQSVQQSKASNLDTYNIKTAHLGS